MPAHPLDNSTVFDQDQPVDLAWFTTAAATLGRDAHLDAAALASDAAHRYGQWLRSAEDWTPVHDDNGTLVAWLDDDGVRPVTADELRARALEEAADDHGLAIDSYDPAL